MATAMHQVASLQETIRWTEHCFLKHFESVGSCLSAESGMRQASSHLVSSHWYLGCLMQVPLLRLLVGNAKRFVDLAEGQTGMEVNLATEVERHLEETADSVKQSEWVLSVGFQLR